MNLPASKTISPAALVQTIKVNLLRRPLWRTQTVEDCLDLDRQQVMAKIDNGEFAFAFEMGESKLRSEPRILALCVIEHQLGPLPAIGATRNLGLPQVIDLILPARDIRSTEIKKIFGVNSSTVSRFKPEFLTVRKPTASDGPDSYSTFSRSSVAAFLEKRRIL